jgi:hypothetical protein
MLRLDDVVARSPVIPLDFLTVSHRRHTLSGRECLNRVETRVVLEYAS